MGIVELQFRKEAFLSLLRAELNRRPLPFPMTPPLFNVLVSPELEGGLLERIECLGCSVEPSSAEGRVTVKADMVIHYHTSLVDVRAAGSLQPAVTKQQPWTIPIELSVAFIGQPKPTLQWTLLSGLLPGGVVPIGLPGEIGDVKAGGMVASGNGIAIRLGTRADDPVNAPVDDRVGQRDWVLLVAGQVLADALTANLAATLDAALTSELILDKPASGAWVTQKLLLMPDPPFTFAKAELTAVDQCLFDIDVSATLSLIGKFQLSGHSLVTTISLSWDADSTFCDIVSGLFLTPIASIAVHVIAEDKTSEAILGKSKDPTGFQEIGRTDDSITYQRTTFIDLRLPSLTLTHSEVTGEGLVMSGTLRIQAGRRGLEGEARPPSSGLDKDCGKRSVSVAFHPAKVSLRDIGLGGPPKLFAESTTFNPPGAWIVMASVSNTWLDLDLTFADPPTGRLAPGTATSVFLHTDCGLRWVDLGVIPADRPPPTLGDVADMLSDCMSISDPWGMGVLNLGWLIDPPDVLRGIDPVRQWSLALRGLPNAVRLEFVARGPDGGARRLGVIEGRRDVAVQITTDADETLEVRTGEPLSAPAPIVSQGWVVPFATMPMDDEAVSMASASGVIGYIGRDGGARLIDTGLDGELRSQQIDGYGVGRPDPRVGRLLETVYEWCGMVGGCASHATPAT